MYGLALHMKVIRHVLSEKYDRRLNGAHTTLILTKEDLTLGYVGLQ